MAIAFDAAEPFETPNSALDGTASWSHTCTGDDRFLLTFFVNVISPGSTSSLYNGENLLPLREVSNSYSLFAHGLAGPASGANSHAMQWGWVDGSYECVGVSISFTGVDQTVQYRDQPVKNSGASSEASITVPTAAGEKVVIAVLTAGATITPTGAQVLRETSLGSAFGFARLSVYESEEEANTFTLGASGEWAAIGISLKPTGSTGTRPVPMLAHFQERLVAAATSFCAAILSNHTDWVANGNGSDGALDTISEAGTGSYYYDGTHVLHTVADYLDSISETALAAVCRTRAGQQLDVIDGAYYGPNSYGVPGYKHFVRGPYDDYLYRDLENSKDIIENLRDLAAYGLDAQSLSVTIRPNSPTDENTLDRELAYHMAAHVYAERAGVDPRTARYEQCLAWAYEYFDDWFVSEGWIGLDQQFSPQMAGLLARSLIEGQETFGADPNLLTALIQACDYLWDETWIPASIGMRYEQNPDAINNGGQSVVGSPVLNNLITTMYAWVAVQTGEAHYMQKADLMFAGDAINGGGFFGGKQFNQQHTWVFEYLRLREQFYTTRKRLKLRVA
jgi:hypothetical protein